MSPIEIVDKMMLTDSYSQWLGIEILEVGLGSCTLTSIIKPEMVNGFGICHGGITFSIADSAFAFASNSHGKHAVSIETSISHLKPANIGDKIRAIASEKHVSSRLGRYDVHLYNQNEELIAIFHGTVFKSETQWK